MSREAFIDALCELELDLGALRSDPQGRAWLPPRLRAELRASSELRMALSGFVDEELALFDDASVPSDALFTARVMSQIPAQSQHGAVDPARRRTILALAYVSAAAVGGAWIARAGLEAGSAGALWQDSLHAWLEALSVGGLALGLALVVSAAALLWPAAPTAVRG